MRVEIDDKSGFCFGVVRAITEAERALGHDRSVGEQGGAFAGLPQAREAALVVQGRDLASMANIERSGAAGCRPTPEQGLEPVHCAASAAAAGRGPAASFPAPWRPGRPVCFVAASP